MTTYTPANQGQLSSNDPLGGLSCVAYSASFAISDATNGRLHPTGAEVRKWTGDKSGGLELSQVDRAVSKMLSLDFDTEVFSASEFYGHLASGYGGILIGGYRPIEASRFSGQRGFTGNHAIYVPPGLKVMDPLADGRHGLYTYHGEAYPQSLIDSFAAALRLGNGTLAGANHFEASLIHLEAAPIPARTYKLIMGAGAFFIYEVSGRTILRRSPHHTGGFSGRCTPPARYTWPGHGTYLLVRMLSGAYGDETRGPGNGRYVAVRASHVQVRET